jgi:hypothetical protein
MVVRRRSAARTKANHQSRKDISMAWVEKRGTLFRVRYRMPDGSVATDSSHPTRTAAKARADDIETDQRRDVFINPDDGKITLAEWVELWTQAHDVGAATWERYRSHLDIHILPRFGDTPLNAITRMAVKAWVKDLNRRRAPATVASILSLLSMLLGEAVEERRIPLNPCRRLRGTAPHRPERPWATAEQVTAIAARVTTPNQALIITAAYTGMRWGANSPDCNATTANSTTPASTSTPTGARCTRSAATSNSAHPKPRPPSATSSCRRS